MSFRFEKVLDLELFDFSEQNVVMHISIEKTEEAYEFSMPPQLRIGRLVRSFRDRGQTASSGRIGEPAAMICNNPRAH